MTTSAQLAALRELRARLALWPGTPPSVLLLVDDYLASVRAADERCTELRNAVAYACTVFDDAPIAEISADAKREIVTAVNGAIAE